MTKRIFGGIFTVSVLTLLACMVLIFGVVYNYFSNQLDDELEKEAVFVSHGIQTGGEAYLEGLDPDESDRITWIAADGTVLYDSEGDASAMENHADREEVREAFETGSGKASRYSSTRSVKTVYFA